MEKLIGVLVAVAFTWSLIALLTQIAHGASPGYASYYGIYYSRLPALVENPALAGQPMAFGGTYDPWDPQTAATPLYPDGAVTADLHDRSWFGTWPRYAAGTWLRVWPRFALSGDPGMDALVDRLTPRVLVEVRDTCPGCGRTARPWVDLSVAAFQRIGDLQAGRIDVWIEVVE